MIPESQLDTWAKQGAITGSKTTCQTIRGALESSSALYKDQAFDIFLQGSYGNDTNIYAESDVDVVICLNSLFGYDITALPVVQQSAFLGGLTYGTYTFAAFKKQVETRLSTVFGSDTVPGNKAIKISANSSRRSADVVTCYEHRRYTRFASQLDCDYVSGIIFPTGYSGTIINYPKQHSKNLTTKHQRTSSWLKPLVRIAKNMRSRLVSDGIIARDVAPSYYVEALFYNVPANMFGGNYGGTFCSCLNWIAGADRSKFVCANGEYFLLGSSNVQWRPELCAQFIDALTNLWNNS